MFFVTLTIIFCVIFGFWHKVKYQRRYELFSKIPSPRKYPIIHNTIDYLKIDPKQSFYWFIGMDKKYGPVYHMTSHPFDEGFCFISDVRVIEDLLINQQELSKTSDYDMLKEWLGTGLLISSGNKWHKRRKILTSGFHFQILEKFAQIMNEQAKVFMEKLENIDRTNVDFFPLVNLFALDTVCECAMGVNIHAQTKNSDYLKAVREMSHVFLIRSISPFYINETVYKWSSLYKKELKILDVLHGFADKIIQSRREELLSKEQKEKEEANLDDISSKKKKALLDILLCSTIDGKPLSNIDIREEVDTFMFAGHDTTTSGISFVFYCLAKNPEAQEKVYEEIRDVLGIGEEITSSKLNNLHYLDLVIKESLRLYPPVAVYGRRINDELTAGGYTFPKETNIYVSAYSLHRNAKYFSDPDTFNPLRFETETTYDIMNPFSYVPFSAGPRNCIGQKFAQLEIKTIVVNVLKSYKITLSNKDQEEELPLMIEIVLRPSNGVHLRLEKRNY